MGSQSINLNPRLAKTLLKTEKSADFHRPFSAFTNKDPAGSLKILKDPQQS